jgi:hypothetical protein
VPDATADIVNGTIIRQNNNGPVPEAEPAQRRLLRSGSA